MEDTRNAHGHFPEKGEISGDRTLLSVLLNTIRKLGTTSRSDVVRETGLGKALVAQYTEQLLGNGIVREIGVGESRGGRRPRLLRFASETGVIGAIDLGSTKMDVAVTDLSAQVLGHQTTETDIAAGPEPALTRIVELLAGLLNSNSLGRRGLWGIGIGLPGPVEMSVGSTVAPPMMPVWADFPVKRYLAERFRCPVYVDSDANMRAVGEAAIGVSVGVPNSVYVKVASGIGAGIIVDGRLYRGSQGCAGEIGHIPVENPGAEPVVCHCGNTNCLQALAGGFALAREAEAAARSGRSPMLAGRMEERGRLTAIDIGEMASRGDAWSTEQIRTSGRLLGHMLTNIVNGLNPDMIIIGGGLSNFGDSFLAAVREMIYRRALPLATRSLRIERSTLGSMGGVIGAAHVVLDELFSPENIKTTLSEHDVPLSMTG